MATKQHSRVAPANACTNVLQSTETAAPAPSSSAYPLPGDMNWAGEAWKHFPLVGRTGEPNTLRFRVMDEAEHPMKLGSRWDSFAVDVQVAGELQAGDQVLAQLGGRTQLAVSLGSDLLENEAGERVRLGDGDGILGPVVWFFSYRAKDAELLTAAL